MFVERQGLIVWLHSLKNIKSLHRYGNVHYISRRLRYAVIYCDQEKAEQVTADLEKISSVKMVEPSHRHEIKLVFEGKKMESEMREEILP